MKEKITDESSSDSKHESDDIYSENYENEAKRGATTTLKYPTDMEEYISDAKRIFN